MKTTTCQVVDLSKLSLVVVLSSLATFQTLPAQAEDNTTSSTGGSHMINGVFVPADLDAASITPALNAVNPPKSETGNSSGNTPGSGYHPPGTIKDPRYLGPPTPGPISTLPPKGGMLAAIHTYVSATVDSRGNVFGIDAQGQRHLVYDRPPNGPAFTSASLNSFGDIIGVYGNGETKTLYTNPRPPTIPAGSPHIY